LTETVKETRTLETPGVDRAAARKEFQTSPIYRNLILGPDGQTTALLLHIRVDATYIDLVQLRDKLRNKRDTEGLSTQEISQLQKVSADFLAYRTQAETNSYKRVTAVRGVVANYRDQATLFVGGVSMIAADMITFIQSDLQVFGVAVLGPVVFDMETSSASGGKPSSSSTLPCTSKASPRRISSPVRPGFTAVTALR